MAEIFSSDIWYHLSTGEPASARVHKKLKQKFQKRRPQLQRRERKRKRRALIKWGAQHNNGAGDKKIKRSCRLARVLSWWCASALAARWGTTNQKAPRGFITWQEWSSEFILSPQSISISTYINLQYIFLNIDLKWFQNQLYNFIIKKRKRSDEICRVYFK